MRYCTQVPYSTAPATCIYNKIMKKFPDVEMSFAYGSAVFKQHGQTDDQAKSNMLDFIFVVKDPYDWHSKNLKMNNNHYSFLKYLTAKNVAKIQDNWGAGVYFNSKVWCEGREIKYGVISSEKLLSDLLDWKWLYISGRLHKPIQIIIPPKDEDILKALYGNLQRAMHAALLTLPEYFTEEELYTRITALSYDGDFRMKFGENKNKVSNIVTPNLPYFNQLYGRILSNEKHLHWDDSKKVFGQYRNNVTQLHHLSLLPQNVLRPLVSKVSVSRRSSLDVEEAIKALSFDPKCGDHVSEAIREIVFRSSARQSVKTIFTAGIWKSVRYSARKIGKMKEGNKS